MAGSPSPQKIDKALGMLFPHPDPAFLTRLETDLLQQAMSARLSRVSR